MIAVTGIGFPTTVLQGSVVNQRSGVELSVAQFRDGSRKLSRLGALLVSLAGGEPLVRPDIVDIVDAVAAWHFPFITTNGWFATPTLAEDLFAAGMWGVSVSIDYADAAHHDQRRGMPGAFERALAAIEYFSAARKYKWQRVNWMAVLLDDNLDQIEPMIRMAAERDVYFMVQPYSARKTGATKFRPRGHGGVGSYLVALRRKHRNFLSNPYFLSRFDAALNGGVPGCRAGRGFFSIDSTGDIAVCVEERAAPSPTCTATTPTRSCAGCGTTRLRGAARRAGITAAGKSRACTTRGEWP